MSAKSLWAVRLSVLGAFFATVWLCGPRAVDVLAARFGADAPRGPMVPLDRVGFVDRPEWLDPPLVLAVSAALSPWLSDEIGLLDEPAARRLREGLRTVPWVRDVAVERAFPDRLRLRFGLRRPALAVQSADGDPLCLVDANAVMLPWVDTPLPVVRLYREGGRSNVAVAPGEVCNETRVRAAAAIAREWRDELAPLVPSCPDLLEVDATNLGERWLRGPEYPEIRVTLRRADGGRVVFGYGRPVDSPLARVAVRTKAQVLASVLDRHPGLAGLIAGDLRFSRRWADYLQPRPPGAPDPNAPWKQLAAPLRIGGDLAGESR